MITQETTVVTLAFVGKNETHAVITNALMLVVCSIVVRTR
jgi:hypothetical protein